MKQKKILSIFAGICITVTLWTIVLGKQMGKEIGKWKEMSDKHLSLFLLMNDWMKVKQEGKSIKKYFEKKGYHSAAIYGLSYVGERLLDELNNCGIEVKYIIDKNAETIYSDMDVYLPEEEIPEVDVIIVTAVYFFNEIHDSLKEKVKCPIVSFKDILSEVK